MFLIVLILIALIVLIFVSKRIYAISPLYIEVMASPKLLHHQRNDLNMSEHDNNINIVTIRNIVY